MSADIDFQATNNLINQMDIPSAPAVLLELHEVMQKDTPEINDIAEVIAKDVGLSALVLRTLNSPFFGMKVEVRSIKQATMLLGLANITNIVAGLALRRAMEESNDPSPPDFWDSPMNVALVAAQLSKRFNIATSDEAYLMGLFLNCGEALVLQKFPDSRDIKREAFDNGVIQVALEDERYRTNHAIIGYFISKRWRLPEHISCIILWHHDATNFLDGQKKENPQKKDLMAICKLAEYIDARFWGRQDDPEWNSCQDAVMLALGISDYELAEVLEEMHDILINAD